MSVLTLFKRAGPAAPAEAVDLCALLIELLRYGQPRLGVYSSAGWHCTVEMNTTASGVRFQASSDYEHKTPTEAALVCRDRIQAALAAMGATKATP